MQFQKKRYTVTDGRKFHFQKKPKNIVVYKDKFSNNVKYLNSTYLPT